VLADTVPADTVPADTLPTDTVPTELVLVGPVPAGRGSSLDGTDIFLQG
jgi:hypothetical protein